MRITELVGRLGADAEVKTSKNGTQFVTMRVASNEFFGGENVTTWVSVIWYGDRAVRMSEYMKKGVQIMAVGKPKASTYATKSGEIAIDETLYADNVDFVGGSSGGTSSNDAVTDTGTFVPKDKKTEKKAEPAPAPVAASDDDDLPF